MALIPIDDNHRLQIAAGTLGRLRGHEFEKYLTNEINKINWSGYIPAVPSSNLFIGEPARHLVSFVISQTDLNSENIVALKAWWLGGLATLGLGDIVEDQGIKVAKSKSDILLEISTSTSTVTLGVSVKSCNKQSPTNDQLYFTTATGFSNLLRANGLKVDDNFEHGLKMFCGDKGFRPADLLSETILKLRVSDPARFFYEELPDPMRRAIHRLFADHQEPVTRILLQKAYINDPYEPQFLIHQTRKYSSADKLEAAIFSIDQLIAYSQQHSGFSVKSYRIRKGSFKHDIFVHQAPRFGFIQFQRGGQKQHPTQLQFNLGAGYFYKIKS